MNPTVKAWREAPQIPPAWSETKAQMEVAAAINIYTYAMRTKTAKLPWIACVFGGCSGRAKICSPKTAPIRSNAPPNRAVPSPVVITPADTQARASR